MQKAFGVLAAAALISLPAAAQEAPTPSPKMISLRFEGWREPVQIESRMAARLIYTAFIRNGFGKILSLEKGPDFAAFRGDFESIPAVPLPQPTDMLSINVSVGPGSEELATLRLARVRSVWWGDFETDVDLSDTPEAQAIFADIEARLLAAR